MASLAQKILDAKAKDIDACTSELERKIDCMVYALYGLSQEEIEAVEGKRAVV